MREEPAPLPDRQQDLVLVGTVNGWSLEAAKTSHPFEQRFVESEAAWRHECRLRLGTSGWLEFQVVDRELGWEWCLYPAGARSNRLVAGNPSAVEVALSVLDGAHGRNFRLKAQAESEVVVKVQLSFREFRLWYDAPDAPDSLPAPAPVPQEPPRPAAATDAGHREGEARAAGGGCADGGARPRGFRCVVIGEPWVPIRQGPDRYCRLLGGLEPNSTVELLEIEHHYGRISWSNNQGQPVDSAWLPLYGNGKPVVRSLESVTLDELLAAVAAANPANEVGLQPQDSGYGDGVKYWDKRYTADQGTFDWLDLGLEEFADLLTEATGGDKRCRILHVGCGTSLLPEQLYDAGYRRVTNTDIAPQVVHQMRCRNRGQRPGICFRVADATDMACFSAGSFDLVIDKTVLDTFACCQDRAVVIGNYLSEVSRVLTARGTMLVLSLAEPARRAPFLEEAPHCSFSVCSSQLPRCDGKKGCWTLLATKVEDENSARRAACWPEMRAALAAGGPPWWGLEE